MDSLEQIKQINPRLAAWVMAEMEAGKSWEEVRGHLLSILRHSLPVRPTQ